MVTEKRKKNKNWNKKKGSTITDENDKKKKLKGWKFKKVREINKLMNNKNIKKLKNNINTKST